MFGAIVGDIVGSIYEFNNKKSKTFKLLDETCTFTDDTLMTLAVFKALKLCKKNYENLGEETIKCMQELAAHYPEVGCGEKFKVWLSQVEPKPYNSWGNGSAMRVSPVAYFANSLEEVKLLSRKVTEISHNHPEGIKGAEAVAVAVFMANQGKTKHEIKDYIEENYYSLDFDYDDLKDNYTFNVSCQNSVPQALYCFLVSKNFNDALRTAVSIGGDTDTICAIAGAVAGAYYGIPKEVEKETKKHLDLELLVLADDMTETMKTSKLQNMRSNTDNEKLF